MIVKYPCKICQKPVAKNHFAIKCDLCNTWVHIACNKITKQTYRILQNDQTQWFCIECNKEFTPFANLTNDEFLFTVKGKKIPFISKRRKHSPEKKQFLENINNINKQNENDTITTYLLPEDFKTENTNNNKNLNLFHLNISSLGYHISDLQDLLSICDIDFHIIGITESRLHATKKGLININIPGFNIEHCPTRGKQWGDTVIY